jgi:hypothetical protein
LRQVLAELMEELCQLQARVKAFDQRIAHAGRSDQRCLRLCKVAGVGPKIATALVAMVGDACGPNVTAVALANHNARVPFSPPSQSRMYYV